MVKMYAKNLSLLLHRQLSDVRSYDDTLKRFESLRGYGQLPKGRERAAQRLSNEEIARAILGFVPSLSGWAGHVALMMSDLRPVGGLDASYKKRSSLIEVMATLLEEEKNYNTLVSLTLSIGGVLGNNEYHARVVFSHGAERKSSCYVSKLATSLSISGAEKNYDHEHPISTNTRQLVLDNKFFFGLARDVDLARHWNKPLDTDWREYNSEEERNIFHKNLGAKPNSNFLNLEVDTTVTWPKDPTRIEFGEHNFVLFPKTKENAASISIDLQNECLSYENARTILNRFLSLLSWCENRHAILRNGWSGNPVPLPVPKHNMASPHMLTWMFYRSMPNDEQLLNCLSYYREGLNADAAEITSQALLCFFKVFEMKKDGRKVRRWVSNVFNDACSNTRESVVEKFHEDRGETSIEDYIYENCRVAVAHASKNFPSDADISYESARLFIAKEVTQCLARYHIRTYFQFSDSYLSDEYEPFRNRQ